MKAPPPKAKHRVIDAGPRAQYGALPWRPAVDGLEILLVTSRETGRWVIPKGWPIPGKTRRGSAAQEALEEAGVSGDTERRPLGAYDYFKFLKSGAGVPCRVTVFALEVRVEEATWREQAQRSVCWFSWPDAAAVVHEPGLSAIIRAFGQRHLATADLTA